MPSFSVLIVISDFNYNTYLLVCKNVSYIVVKTRLTANTNIIFIWFHFLHFIHHCYRRRNCITMWKTSYLFFVAKLTDWLNAVPTVPLGVTTSIIRATLQWLTSVEIKGHSPFILMICTLWLRVCLVTGPRRRPAWFTRWSGFNLLTEGLCCAWSGCC